MVNIDIPRRGWLIIIIAFPLAVCMYLIIIFSRYVFSCYKGERTVFIDNLVLIAHDNSGVGIPLRIINEDEKEKVTWYIKKYLNKDVSDLEIKLFKIPEFIAWNLVKDEKHKEKILKEKFT